MDLNEILIATLELQRESFGIDPPKLTGERRAEYVRSMVLAATDELHEALAEVVWKPWKPTYEQGEFVNREAYVEELVDVLHFLMNLLLVADVSGHELARVYEKKHAINVTRMA